MADTDMYALDVPLLLQARHEFLAGQWNWWNPYLMAGTPASLYGNAPLLSIDFWPLFFLPEKYFLLAATYLTFLKMGLIGVTGYFLFRVEINDTRWAFFASTIYQLCGYTLWWVTKIDAINMWLLFTLILYLCWTLDKRPSWKNYLWMTLSLVALLLPGHTAINSHLLILISGLYLYHFLSRFGSGACFKHMMVFVASMATAMLIFMIRLLPAFSDYLESDRLNSFSWDFRDLSFLVLRLFNPEILGVDIWTSGQVIRNFGYNFNDIHTHAFMPQYFGVVPAVLAVWALINSKNGKVFFWSLYTLGALALSARIEPFETLMRSLLHPVYHSLSIQIFLPVGFCILAGLAGKQLEEGPLENISWNRSLSYFYIFFLLVLFYLLMVWAPFIPEIISVSKGIFIFLVLIVSGIWLGKKQYPGWEPFKIPDPHAALILSATGLALLLIPFNIKAIEQSHLKMMIVSWIMILFILATIQIHLSNSRKEPHAIPLLWIFSGTTILLGTLLFPWVHEVRQIPGIYKSFILASLGTGKLVLCVMVFSIIISNLRNHNFKTKWIFPALMALLVADQIPASKIHSHISSNPFYTYADIYPEAHHLPIADASLSENDLKNYRFNHPHLAIRTPYYTGLYGKTEVMGAVFAKYGMRSYGGYINARSRRYQEFLTSFLGFTSEVGLYTNVKNQDRFLDLLSVKYDYDLKNGRMITRTNSLSRFMLFSSFETLEDEKKTLARLKDKEFNPQKTLLVDAPAPFETVDKLSRKINYTEISADHIELDVTPTTNSLLLFNDSFHKGWKVWIDGREQSLIRANYNFMAVPVPSGPHRVVLKFEPRAALLGKSLAWLGLGIGVILTLFLFFLKTKLKERNQFNQAPVSLNHRLIGHILSFRSSYRLLTFLTVIALLQSLFNLKTFFPVL